MIAAAKAVLDPVHGSSGTRIAWNAMWSPEAKSAMLSRACIELGAQLISKGTEGVASDLIAARDPAFKSALETIESAQDALKKTKDPAERAALQATIKKADTILVRAYQAGTSVTANLISGAAAEKGESGLGRKD
jgi:Xaa-Pro aminopeptidase